MAQKKVPSKFMVYLIQNRAEVKKRQLFLEAQKAKKDLEISKNKIEKIETSKKNNNIDSKLTKKYGKREFEGIGNKTSGLRKRRFHQSEKKI